MNTLLHRLLLCFAIGLLLLGTSTASLAGSYPGGADGEPSHEEMDILTACQMHIYSSIVLQVYDLSPIENQAKSRICGVEQQFTPARSLEEIARLFADYGMDRTASEFHISFDQYYVREVLELTEIILKTYQTGYEKALRSQISGQTGDHAFCSAFLHNQGIETN